MCGQNLTHAKERKEEGVVKMEGEERFMGKALAALVTLVLLIPVLPILTEGDAPQANINKTISINNFYVGNKIIKLADSEFDVDVGPGNLPNELSISGYRGNMPGYYIVQFKGPVQELWKALLTSVGARICNYVPYNAFAVQMSGIAKAEVEAMPFVQYVGIYQPAFKLPAYLLDGVSLAKDINIIDGSVDIGYENAVKMATGLGDSINRLTVTILLHDGENANGVAAFICKAGGKVTGISENSVRAEVSRNGIQSLAYLNGVRYVSQYHMPEPMMADTTWTVQSKVTGVNSIWDHGIWGNWSNFPTSSWGNITIGVADTGLDTDHEMFYHPGYTPSNWVGDSPNHRKVVGYYQLGDNRVDYQGHGTHVCGIVAGNGSYAGSGNANRHGMAPSAKLTFCDVGISDNGEGTNDVTLGGILPDLKDMYTFQRDDGASLSINPWCSNAGYDSTVPPDGTKDARTWEEGNYTDDCENSDEYMWLNKEFQIFFPAGGMRGTPIYGGPAYTTTMMPPATGKNVIGVASTYSGNGATGWDDLYDFSSWGATDDGRLKPDVSTVGGMDSAGTDGSRDGNLDVGYAFMTGSSMAAACAAGSTALIAQYYRQGWYPVAGTIPVLGNGFVPSNALLKATLINGCMDSTTGDYANDHPYILNGHNMAYPNTDQGWGMVHLDDSLYFSGDAREMWVDDYKNGFITGQLREYKMAVQTGQPLEISLVWTDYQGSTETAGALINDLDLTLISPTGAKYLGNNYGPSSRESDSTNPAGVDHTNNIECALIKLPTAGTWTIYVNATNIPVGQQPYALVATGNFDDGYGWVKLDKSVYHYQDTVTVEVEDVNAGAGPLTATLTSSTGDVETVTLNQVLSNTGRYTGTINTKFEYPANYSGNISIENNGWLSVRYADFSPVHASYANATTDASMPHITNVYVTDIESNAATIHWDTDVPSTSQVFYGTTPALGSWSTLYHDKALHHQVTVGGLSSFTTYYFDVESTSIADITTRDTNGGDHYKFMTKGIGDILLVIGGDGEASSIKTESLIQYYKDALDFKNWSYNIWQTRLSGDPSLALLQSYKAIIWQVNLENYPQFTDAQRALVTAYNNGGGRLWVVSHDVAWNFGDPTANDYTVERFQWCTAQLKAYWISDDSTFNTVTGNATDPISGGYTGGAGYSPFRSGGAGDQVGHNQTDYGGTDIDIWFSNGAHAGLPCGLRWTSSANNGSAGVGEWGGTPTKIVVYFFEWIRITNQYARSDILDKTLQWLIGSGPPSVQVTSPNGGNVVSGITSITWTHSGSINTQDIQISKDGGASWLVEATGLPGGQTSYGWDTTKQSAGNPIYPNGQYYRVKVIANGPILSTADISDSNFSVNNGLSGDKTGPVIQAGSIKPSPIPVGRTDPLNVTAIADDRAKGNSNISVIEVYVDGTAPGNKRGNMNPIDVFDSPMEKGYVNFTATYTGGAHTLYVRAQDVAGNWGGFESAQFYVILGLNVPPIVDLSYPNGTEKFAGGSNQTIWWNMSDDRDAVSALRVNISYSTNGAAGPWTPIVTGLTGLTSNPCSYSWNLLPFIDSTTVRVKVNATDLNGLGAEDMSEANFTIDSTWPLPATNFRAELTGINDVTLYWTPSPSPDVAYCQIWSITNGWDPAAFVYSLLYQTPNNANTSYTHGAQGNFSGNEVCYQIRTFDQVGHETRTIVQAAKYTKLISASGTVAWGGWIMLGSFLNQSSYEVSHKLQGQGFGMNGFHNWSALELYDAWDNADHWKVNVRNATAANQWEISTISNTQGFWACVYNAARYTSAGYISNMSIPLRAGWNQVPYPFAARSWSTQQIRNHLIANCSSFSGTYNDMEIMNRFAPYRLMTPTGTETLTHQDALWVRVSANTIWTVINYY